LKTNSKKNKQVTNEDKVMASTQNRAAISRNLEVTGLLLIRYGVVLILFWIGLLKFTSYEANGIKPFVEKVHS